MSDYEKFLSGKSFRFNPCGFDPVDLTPALFPFQRDIVRLANLKIAKQRQEGLFQAAQVAE